MKKIMLAVGTRPDFIKMAPIYYELKKYSSQFEIKIVHCGLHDDYSLSGQFFSQFELPAPDYKLDFEFGSPAERVGKIMIWAEEIYKLTCPDLVLVFGQADSTLAYSLAASKMNISIGHIEAGLRMNKHPYNSESNNTITDLLAEYHFTSCDECNLSLIREGRDIEKVFLVGSIYSDTIKHFLPDIARSNLLEKMNLEQQEYILATVHKAYNLDDIDRLKKLTEVLAAASELAPIVFPVHPDTRAKLESEAFGSTVLENVNIQVIEPSGYVEFLTLMKNAAVVMTDSGGVQEECSCLGQSCLTLLTKTDRKVTVSDGSNIVCDLKQDKILSQIEFCLQKNQPPKRKPFLWDGQASERIVKHLCDNIQWNETEYYKGENKIPFGKTAVSVMI